MIEQELYSLLSAGVASVAGRVYALYAPQIQDRPYIVTTKVASTRVYSHDGDSELTRELFQISCYHDSYNDLKLTVAEVRAAMDSWAIPAQQLNERDAHEVDVNLFSCAIDYYVWHKL